MKFLWTTITVENLDESIAFYTDMTGLRVLRRFSVEPGVEIAFMGNGNDSETLIELLSDSGNGTVGFSEFISVGFAVDSVEEMLAALQREGIPVSVGPVETQTRIWCRIKDPDGLTVQFIQQTNAAYDDRGGAP